MTEDKIGGEPDTDFIPTYLGGIIRSKGGPRDGHRWRFSLESCGASAIQESGDVEPHSYADSGWWYTHRTIEVRASSLRAALEQLIELPLQDWFPEDHV